MYLFEPESVTLNGLPEEQITVERQPVVVMLTRGKSQFKGKKSLYHATGGGCSHSVEMKLTMETDIYGAAYDMRFEDKTPPHPTDMWNSLEKASPSW